VPCTDKNNRLFTVHTDELNTSEGFDAAKKCREEDYLNRWPIAREIYGIATTGPQDWSIRVGIYGEWGTGKTSVLEFIDSMAKESDNILVRFNPWEHTTKDSLWRSFVMELLKNPTLRKIKGVKRAHFKRRLNWLGGSSKIIETSAGIINDKVGKAFGVGLDSVKKLLSFSQKDLKELHGSLGKRRVIIIIDDLDRTAPELVPEILFALKELMNIPGFSFICAFDPVVVGNVLSKYHLGFGDGLRFLEKIIDYPCWLPPAPACGLVKLAIADAKRFCPYVPELSLRDAVPMLPSNPRAIRQFIRLLALLQPQIERHYEYELHWPVILAANVLKIRHPRIANSLLKSESFWQNVGYITMRAKGEDEKGELSKAIDTHLAATLTSHGLSLGPEERKEVVEVMKSLCSTVNIWVDGGAAHRFYQMDIAEAPNAVTWKEFERFAEAWERDATSKAAHQWMSQHSNEIEQPFPKVYREIFTATVQRYAETLRRADSVRVQAELTTLLEKSKTYFALLECLALDLGQVECAEKLSDEANLEVLFDTFASILNSTGVAHEKFKTRNEVLLLKFVEKWHGDNYPLIKTIRPYHQLEDRFRSQGAQSLHRKLCKLVLVKYAQQMTGNFRQNGFVPRLSSKLEGTFEMRCLVLNENGPLWTDFRRSTLAVFDEAKSNFAVQNNAYELIYWFDYLLRNEKGTLNATSAKNLILDKEVLDSIWAAATVHPLSQIGTARLKGFIELLESLGTSVGLPNWWNENIKAMHVSAPLAVTSMRSGNRTEESKE
jgi:hypothetical protein